MAEDYLLPRIGVIFSPELRATKPFDSHTKRRGSEESVGRFFLDLERGSTSSETSLSSRSITPTSFCSSQMTTDEMRLSSSSSCAEEISEEPLTESDYEKIANGRVDHLRSFYKKSIARFLVGSFATKMFFSHKSKAAELAAIDAEAKVKAEAKFKILCWCTLGLALIIGWIYLGMKYLIEGTYNDIASFPNDLIIDDYASERALFFQKKPDKNSYSDAISFARKAVHMHLLLNPEVQKYKLEDLNRIKAYQFAKALAFLRSQYENMAIVKTHADVYSHAAVYLLKRKIQTFCPLFDKETFLLETSEEYLWHRKDLRMSLEAMKIYESYFNFVIENLVELEIKDKNKCKEAITLMLANATQKDFRDDRALQTAQSMVFLNRKYNSKPFIVTLAEERLRGNNDYNLYAETLFYHLDRIIDKGPLAHAQRYRKKYNITLIDGLNDFSLSNQPILKDVATAIVCSSDQKLFLEEHPIRILPTPGQRKGITLLEAAHNYLLRGDILSYQEFRYILLCDMISRRCMDDFRRFGFHRPSWA